MNLTNLQERLRKKELSTAEAGTALRIREVARARKALQVLQALGFLVSDDRVDAWGTRTFWRFKDWTYGFGRPFPKSPEAGRKASRLAEVDGECLRRLLKLT